MDFVLLVLVATRKLFLYYCAIVLSFDLKLERLSPLTIKKKKEKKENKNKMPTKGNSHFKYVI